MLYGANWLGTTECVEEEWGSLVFFSAVQNKIDFDSIELSRIFKVQLFKTQEIETDF